MCIQYHDYGESRVVCGALLAVTCLQVVPMLFRNYNVSRCCLWWCVDSPETEVSPAVVNAGEEVTLRCSVQFGAPRNTSRRLATEQFPRLTMSLNDVELTTATPQYTYGHPGERSYTITKVCLALLQVLSVWYLTVMSVSCLKPNSITLAGLELKFGLSSSLLAVN